MNPSLEQAAKTLMSRNVNLNLNVQCPVDRAVNEAVGWPVYSAVDLVVYQSVDSAVYRR